MTTLSLSFMQGRWLRWWLTASFAVLFSGVFLFDSHTALLNVVDMLFFLPALTLLTRAVVSGDRRLLTSKILWPLYAFLAWALFSMLWADQPNLTRTVRGAVQIVILVGLFRWLQLYFPNTFKQALTNGAICAAMVAMMVIISYYTTQPLSSALYSAPTNLIFHLPSLNPTEALMAMLAPTFVLLFQAMEEGIGGKGGRRFAGAVAGFFFLTLVSVPLGVMSIALAVSWLISRSRRYRLWALLPLLAALVSLASATDLSAIGRYLDAPWIGNGLNQATLNHVVVGHGDAAMTIAHPHNIYLLALHSLGIVGLLLLLACWLVPLLSLIKNKQALLAEPLLTLTALPGLLMVLAAGAYLLVPFHASWLALWLPLALLLARFSERSNIRPDASR